MTDFTPINRDVPENAVVDDGHARLIDCTALKQGTAYNAMGFMASDRYAPTIFRYATRKLTKRDGMEKEYRYIGIGRHYFCVDQSLLFLAWTLLVNHRRLQLASMDLRASDVAAAIIKISLYRLRLKRRARIVSMPFFGNVCRAVHRGHKIFNFRRATVIKTFAAGLAPDEVESEITATVARGTLNFSPDVIRYSLDRRWYEEAYILGEPGLEYYGADKKAFWPRFHGDLLPVLQQILLIEPLEHTRLGDYVDATINRLKTCLRRPERAPDLADLVLTFAADYLEDDLRSAADETVLIGFSHGDFALVNILRTSDKAVVIDWESCGRRSYLFDLYSFLFGELHKRRATAISGEELNHAIRQIESTLMIEAAEPASSAPMPDIYRKLFYLERLLILAERNLPDKQFLRVVMRTIEVFSRFETELNSPHQQPDPPEIHDRTTADASTRDPKPGPGRRMPLIILGALLSLAVGSTV